ncbi:cytochrome P450 monooxygenase [Apiospora kogelbergensis]|uniref:Cytochrome P450 monooxygenase n=1 Tax=Apiospora kogelbergensis TaxID=1337665 RepID=A0AAW0RB41_9PEZI
METLRLYPSAVAIPKWTGNRDQTLRVGGKPCVIPAKTMVNLSLNGLHFNPKYWGRSPSVYRPQNWDARKTGGPGAADHAVRQHPDPGGGRVRALQRGARACLGKRFSQVEFAAVMAVIFREYRVELVRGDGKTWEQARQETAETLESCLSYLTLSLQKRVPLRFVKRGKYRG